MDPLGSPRAPILAEPLESLAAYLELFANASDDVQYEVVDGQPVVSPSPGGAHQRCVRRAVEVISAGSFERDTVTKRAEYAKAGLSDYWIVDPESAEVFVHRRVVDELRLQEVVDATSPRIVTSPFPVLLDLGPVDD